MLAKLIAQYLTAKNSGLATAWAFAGLRLSEVTGLTADEVLTEPRYWLAYVAARRLLRGA